MWLRFRSLFRCKLAIVAADKFNCSIKCKILLCSHDVAYKQGVPIRRKNTLVTVTRGLFVNDPIIGQLLHAKG